MSGPLRKFLTQAADDPAQSIRNRRWRTPTFCHDYFDLCDANSLECDRTALAHPEIVIDPARIAVRLTTVFVGQAPPDHRLRRSGSA
jgi:hypothetical protein